MDTQPVAKITLSKVDRKTNVLYDSMFLADTNRAAYQPTKLTAGELQQLLTININPNLTLKFYQDEQNLKKLGDYAIAGTKIEAGIHRMNVESANIFRANEWQKNEYRYGFSVEGQGTTGVMKYFLEGLITLVPLFNNENTSASRDITITETAVTNTPAYAMIISKNNSRIEQVESGMLYSKLILTAHSLGFVMQPPSQVLEEYPEMKEQYNSIHSNYAPTGGTIQMFIRIGKPTQTYPPTMRKDVMNLVE
jgi:hypothetical protein